MDFVDAFRDPAAVRRWVDAIAATARKPWCLMELCGGQTHNMIRFGIDELLPPSLRFIHGPGCPVCVTPVAMIDAAIALARRPRTKLCTYGDMLRVPGSQSDLAAARAMGGDVRVVHSPRDAVILAEADPSCDVVLFAVGFETTAPATALAVLEAEARALRNFSAVVAHVLVPPAMEAILAAPHRVVQGFLAAGHVCTVTGCGEYHAVSARHRVPIVVTGFEPVDILQGVYLCVSQLEAGRAEVQNQYHRSVRPEGNVHARELLARVFAPCDRDWRGIGPIPRSGYRLRSRYARFDALARFGLGAGAGREDPACRAGDVLQGWLKPTECPEFGVRCHPGHPLGAPMVSSEGACAAYHLYKTRSRPP